MTRPFEAMPRRGTLCCICGLPMPLETGNTDELGKAVHEECYVRETISRLRTPLVTEARESRLSAVFVRIQPSWISTLIEV